MVLSWLVGELKCQSLLDDLRYCVFHELGYSGF